MDQEFKQSSVNSQTEKTQETIQSTEDRSPPTPQQPSSQKAQQDAELEVLLLKHQLEEIKRYVNQFPLEEREMRAMEWVENQAHRYRETIEEIREFVRSHLEPPN